MGDPKKLRKKYSPPKHPWQAARIAAERPLMHEYGLKNKKEIWKAQSKLKKFTNQAKLLSTIKNEHQEREKQQLLNRLIKLGLLEKGKDREDVLGLNLRNILDRRLQTLTLKKGLAKTSNQARQLIVHGHVAVNGQKITIPSYLVNADEEDKISYLSKSSFNNTENPERVLIEQYKNRDTKEEKIVKDMNKERRNKQRNRREVKRR